MAEGQGSPSWCVECGYETTHLDFHDMKRHPDLYRCHHGTCVYRTRSLKEFLCHLEANVSHVTNNVLSCHTCRLHIGEDLQDLQIHVKTCPDTLDLFRCESCVATFTDPVELLDHTCDCACPDDTRVRRELYQAMWDSADASVKLRELQREMDEMSLAMSTQNE
jgi:hypothetical protein